ncbi:hypothetical protein [uncultured Cohaesibacter sp.]|uniref:hypothetical protein n=1 Tax=uncultured Cohaesibacter sp. TaxID=1002546 RepID=UPI0029C6F535|nr:hypothetical protein [uncultured Cohaesibacter sp.]
MDEKPAPSGVEAVTKYRAGGREWNDINDATAFATVIELLEALPRIQGEVYGYLEDIADERRKEILGKPVLNPSIERHADLVIAKRKKRAEELSQNPYRRPPYRRSLL